MTRPVLSFRDLDRHDIAAIIALPNAATTTERILLGGGAAHRQYTDDQRRENGPVIKVLGPEALAGMGIVVGNLVQKLSKVTEHRKAEMARTAIAHDPDEDAYLLADAEYDPCGPGRHWRDVGDGYENE